MIELKDVLYAYGKHPALRGISLNIGDGEHIALVGPNASGKSTLAMMMNALLMPDRGDCTVEGISTRDDPLFARRSVAMVFQDPEDQAVARKVWDDVAFGPRNLGLSADATERRVKNALKAVGLERQAVKSMAALSGGQRQLAAMAGALAMEPLFIVLDEPTSMLDGDGAKAVRDAILSLKRRGTGIIWITHDMDEAMTADRIVALKEGKVLASGSPDELFCDEELMAKAGIEASYTWRLSKKLKELEADFPGARGE
jgi:energy-coupling factor transporter ATP-binding protein EcfA2